MSNNSDLIANFVGITGVDAERAQFYLESSAWNIDSAIASFYNDDDEDSNDVNVPTQPETRATAKAQNPTQQSRFATISNLRSENSDSSDEERQSFYTGGSEHGGGQQVLGDKKKKSKELVEDMFKSAKEHGAEEVSAGSSASERPGKKPVFRGTGYKLGETEDGSEMVEGGPMDTERRQVDMVLKLWRNGFSVDDGPLRDYQDPENQDFLNCIKKGEVPRELTRNARGGEVNLNMEDHREEEFLKPKVNVKAFSGSGNRLGSTVPAVVSPPVSQAEVKQAEESAKASVSLDASQPATSIQIRLADGTRLVAKFNHSHNVADIRRFITASRPQFVTANYVLMTTFPNKELDNENQTIEQAKLQNAVIVQRMK